MTLLARPFLVGTIACNPLDRALSISRTQYITQERQKKDVAVRRIPLRGNAGLESMDETEGEGTARKRPEGSFGSGEFFVCVLVMAELKFASVHIPYCYLHNLLAACIQSPLISLSQSIVLYAYRFRIAIIKASHISSRTIH